MPTRCGLLAEGFRDNIKFGLELGNFNRIDDQTLVAVSVWYSFMGRQVPQGNVLLGLEGDAKPVQQEALVHRN